MKFQTQCFTSNRMGVVLKAALVIVVAALAHFAFIAYTTWQTSSHNHNHRPGVCTAVKIQNHGSEDFEVLSSGFALITSGLRYKMLGPATQDFWRRHQTKGRIYVMNLNDVSAGARELPIAPTSDFDVDTFSPHGISVWEDNETGRHTVFMVNHPYTDLPSSERVEEFVYDSKQERLFHLRTYMHPSMRDVNDVQATGKNSFYFTNSNYYRPTGQLLLLLEVSLKLALTNVVHCKLTVGHSVDCQEVATGLAGTNGVTMSRDGKYVYVAEMVAGQVVVYNRNSVDNTLIKQQVYPVHAWPDNIVVDRSNGDLYVAVHGSPGQFFHYADNIGARKSPSHVLRLKVSNGVIVSTQELLYDEGDLISAASTAVIHNRTLLVGSVFHTLVTCPVTVPLL